MGKALLTTCRFSSRLSPTLWLDKDWRGAELRRLLPLSWRRRKASWQPCWRTERETAPPCVKRSPNSPQPCRSTRLWFRWGIRIKKDTFYCTLQKKKPKVEYSEFSMIFFPIFLQLFYFKHTCLMQIQTWSEILGNLTISTLYSQTVLNVWEEKQCSVMFLFA